MPVGRARLRQVKIRGVFCGLLGSVKLPRTLRALFALLALAGVLFSQLAVAAYACPGVGAMAPLAMAAPGESAAPDCHRMPGPQTIDALCRAHCQQGDQSVERVTAPAFAPAVGPACFVLRMEPAAAVPARPSAQPSLLERPTEPPASVRHCRFLI